MKLSLKHRMFGAELPSQAEASTRGLRSFYRERSQLTQHNVWRWYDVGGVPNRIKLQKNETRTAETSKRLPVSHYLMCLSTVRDRHEWHKKAPSSANETHAQLLDWPAGSNCNCTALHNRVRYRAAFYTIHRISSIWQYDRCETVLVLWPFVLPRCERHSCRAGRISTSRKLDDGGGLIQIEAVAADIRCSSMQCDAHWRSRSYMTLFPLATEASKQLEACHALRLICFVGVYISPST